MRASSPFLTPFSRVGGVRWAAPVYGWGFALALAAVSAAVASPFATQVISAQGPFGVAPYDDAGAVLGAPATWFYDQFAIFGGGSPTGRVKLVEAAFKVSPPGPGGGSNLLLTLGAGSRVVVRFDHPIVDDPLHPYGVDLLVFGNAFYVNSGFAGDGSDMSDCWLTGGIYEEAVKISVSPGCTGLPGETPEDPDTWPWYRYDNGPYADSDFPTQAYPWNRAATNWSAEPMDFTKPVNPELKGLLRAGNLTAADAIDLYAGSGGGAGYDLQASGFPWIQYVKAEGLDPNFSDGEIDAVAAVRRMVVGDVLSLAPSNLANGTGRLFFQQPGDEQRTALSVQFNSLGGLAQVATQPLGEGAGYAPLPGVALNAVRLGISGLPVPDAVAFNADLALSVGAGYAGDGGDLLVLSASGTNWNFVPFTFQPANHQVLVTGVTNVSALVAVRFTPPRLAGVRDADGFTLGFTPLAGLSHTLERSTNLLAWTPLISIPATNGQPVSWRDAAPPADRAFYRLRLERP